MNNKKIKKPDLSDIRIIKELDMYKGKVLFPEALAKANEVLKKTKLPDEYYKRQQS
jgi:hypothetical protein